MFCPKCDAEGHPKVGDSFVVFGSEAKKYHPRYCTSHTITIGYTPHIISFTQPLTMKDGNIQLTVTCGVCGASFIYKDPNIAYTFTGTHFIYVSKNDFKALLMSWTNTGYEII